MTVEPESPSLSRSAALMGVGTVLSRVTGFGRLLALVYVLGVDQLADTYNLANNVPNMIYELIVGGILSATLVPVFVSELSTRQPPDAWRAISAIFTATLALLVVATAALMVFAPFAIDLYTWGNDSYTDEQTEVATFLLRLFAPQILVYGFIGLATGLLHARRSFGPPMFAPICNNITVICMLLALPHVAGNLSPDNVYIDDTGLLLLGIGTTAGVVAMGLLLIPYLRRTTAGRMQLHWEPRHEAVRSMLRMSGWTVGFVIANQIALWITIVLATRGNDGDLTAFFAAYTLFILPHGIFAVSIMSALQPDLAEQWSRGQLDRFREQMASGTRVILAIIAPAAVGYALLAGAIASVVLEHGQVDAGGSHTAGRVLFWMLVGLPGFSTFIYLTRVFQAMHRAKTVFYLYVIENGINLLTAFPLHDAMGITGLALSQSIAYSATAVIGMLVLRREMTSFAGTFLGGSLARIGIAAAVMGIVVAGIVTGTKDSPIIQVCMAAPIGVITYVFIGRIVGIAEMQTLRKRLPF